MRHLTVQTWLVYFSLSVQPLFSNFGGNHEEVDSLGGNSGSPGQVTNGSVEVVSGNSVISGSLDVQGGKVHAGMSLLRVLEQVVGHLLSDELEKNKKY